MKLLIFIGLLLLTGCYGVTGHVNCPGVYEGPATEAYMASSGTFFKTTEKAYGVAPTVKCVITKELK